MVRFTEMGNNPKTALNFAQLEDFHKENAFYRGKNELSDQYLVKSQEWREIVFQDT